MSKAPIHVFTSFFHKGLDKNSFKVTFVKAAWKAYTDQTKEPISQSQFQTIIAELYNWFFLNKKIDHALVLSRIRKLFRNSEAVELFLSDTFHILLNYYIKSFYGQLGGWDKIVSFTTSIERFIMYVSNRTDEESFFVFEDALINAIEKLRQRAETITVLNTYYGVPIQYPAKILHTNPESVIICVHPLQVTAAILQKGIYLLKNSQFINDVYAAVNPVMINGSRVLKLRRFDQLEHSLFHRQSVRVQPSRLVQIAIVDKEVDIRCTLYDISIEGIAITSKHTYPLAYQSEVMLIFPSEILSTLNKVSGELVFKSSYERGHKYHFKIFPTLQQESELGQYIARRQQEIIKKLRNEVV